ncbi:MULTISPECIES: DUF3800 domain-containing protein [unclassified Microbacterium]|uniref:DUF3800 domain-containing protein n=1 Tax=unclassified Microbacterium TaxID=2609290 RepID=UPI003465DFF8
MLLAYIDEIGETGSFVDRTHPRFNTSPAFGYAGFIIPHQNARQFGAIFAEQKQTLFRTEIGAAEHPGRWERKGASIFRPDTDRTYPQQIRVFGSLVRRLRTLQGNLFYYADEKPLGSPKQTSLNTEERETAAMREALNRIARHADSCDRNVMVMIDQINEKTRATRLPKMYSHVLGRASEHPEMRRIIEPPMHIDSVLSSSIQFADWVAACVTRAIEYQLIRDSPYEWVTTTPMLRSLRGAFTHESKVHLYLKSIVDLNHSEIFNRTRRVHPTPDGQLLSASVDPSVLRRIHAAAEKGNR